MPYERTPEEIVIGPKHRLADVGSKPWSEAVALGMSDPELTHTYADLFDPMEKTGKDPDTFALHKINIMGLPVAGLLRQNW